MFRKPLTKFQQLRLRSTSGIVPQLQRIPQIQEEETDHDINQDVNRKIRSVLSEHIANKPSQLEKISKYYFDGEGKAFRPKLIMNMADAVNAHLEVEPDEILEKKQYEVAMISEMYHTSSLYHDDVIDNAEIRRNKTSVNHLWGQKNSIFGGNHVIATSNILLGRFRDPQVVTIMSRTLHDLVLGELQQLTTKSQRDDRFDTYMKKTYNKTASLMANSCQAVAQMASTASNTGRKNGKKKRADDAIQAAFLYGKNLGIAFQLIDDYLDFSASAASLGKPAAADLKLGLATAPVLFAADEREELDSLINRRFSHEGDVDRAFNLVIASNGLEQTQFLAKSYGKAALHSIQLWKDSHAKDELIHFITTAIERTK